MTKSYFNWFVSEMEKLDGALAKKVQRKEDKTLFITLKKSEFQKYIQDMHVMVDRKKKSIHMDEKGMHIEYRLERIYLCKE